jgi:hypothetical protein
MRKEITKEEWFQYELKVHFSDGAYRKRTLERYSPLDEENFLYYQMKLPIWKMDTGEYYNTNFITSIEIGIKDIQNVIGDSELGLGLYATLEGIEKYNEEVLKKKKWQF